MPEYRADTKCQERLWFQFYQVPDKSVRTAALSAPCAFQLSSKTANLSHKSPAARPGCATCHSKMTRTNSHMLYRYQVTYPREVRFIKPLPTLPHFPGNCTNQEFMKNNEPAHRGREDNSEQQQRKLMGKYVLIVRCRQLLLQACITSREVSPPWKDAGPAEPHTTHAAREHKRKVAAA